ncbi:MAG: hypothetical protein M3O61_17900 [Gemmatimonadota bacterium]|nr:hypothetical protein [Gemmatimonadota bacterium]
MTLAQAWEESKERGFPNEIADILKSAQRSDWATLRLLLAIPEFKVPLPGGTTASQTDLAAIARGEKGLVAIAVEGKVSESFGPTMGERRKGRAIDNDVRLSFLCEQLGLANGCPDQIRYQLLHRTVSALTIARDFFAESAVMLVHSFHSDSKWLDDFVAFADLFGCEAKKGQLCNLGSRNGVRLYIGWASGKAV